VANCGNWEGMDNSTVKHYTDTASVTATDAAEGMVNTAREAKARSFGKGKQQPSLFGPEGL